MWSAGSRCRTRVHAYANVRTRWNMCVCVLCVNRHLLSHHALCGQLLYQTLCEHAHHEVTTPSCWLSSLSLKHWSFVQPPPIFFIFFLKFYSHLFTIKWIQMSCLISLVLYIHVCHHCIFPIATLFTFGQFIFPLWCNHLLLLLPPCCRYAILTCILLRRNSPSFRSFEEKVENTVSTIKVITAVYFLWTWLS